MLALALPLLIIASPAPPTPAQALLQPMRAPRRVALDEQAEDSGQKRKEEEKALEKDMDRAREHLGHKHDHADEHEHEDGGPGHAHDASETWRRYDERERSGRSWERYAPSSDSPEIEYEYDAPAYEPTYRPTIDGHGKAYYLVWGIIDYAIAGQLWLGGTVLGLGALVIGTNADEIAGGGDFCRPDCTEQEARNAVRGLALLYGVVAVGAVVTGFVFAAKAENNLDKHGVLAATTHGPRPRSPRDWDEHAYELHAD